MSTMTDNKVSAATGGMFVIFRAEIKVLGITKQANLENSYKKGSLRKGKTASKQKMNNWVRKYVKERSVRERRHAKQSNAK